MSPSMIRVLLLTLLAGAVGVVPAAAEPMPIYPDHQRAAAPRSVGGPGVYHEHRPHPPGRVYPHAERPAPRYEGPRYIAPQTAMPSQARAAHPPQANLGGGLIEFLFGDSRPVPLSEPQPLTQPWPYDERQRGWSAERPARQASLHGHSTAIPPPMDPRFLPQVVPYGGDERPGTIIIDTAQRFLFLVQDDGTARRYGVGVGREGFGWRGTETISAKREWPDWRPPPQMLKREPHLPRHMPGGPDNPLGARALYLGSTLYRIHGSNEPWTIGQAVSSGCIRMRNEDVMDLYERVRIGTRVVVL